MCYCAEKVQGADRCTLDSISNGIPCRLNAVGAVDSYKAISESPPRKPNMINAGGKGKGVAAGAVAVAAVGAVAGITL